MKKQGNPTSLTTKQKKQNAMRKINPAKTKQLMALGLPGSDIAKHQGVNPSAITRYIQSLTPEEIKEYNVKRSDYLTLDQIEGKAAVHRVLKHFNNLEDSEFDAMPDDKKIGYGNLGNVSSGTAFDKQRINDGLSRDITDPMILVVNLQVAIKAMRAEQAIEGEIVDSPVDIVVDKCPNG